MENLERIQYIWASDSNLKAPTAEQFSIGWVQNQFPPSEIVNYLQQRADANIKEIARVGISEWVDFELYKPSNLVVRNGVHYVAVIENMGIEPNKDNIQWARAWDTYGSASAIAQQIEEAKTVEGFWGLYVSKARPVMTGKATAPAYQANIGSGTLDSGYLFNRPSITGMQAMTDGSLVFSVDGVVNGRIKKSPPTLAMNDDTLVTTKLLNEVITQIRKSTELPVGWTVITNNPKPPSDEAQLGYGTWVQDCQGRAVVGVSTKVGDPTWTKAVNGLHGEFTVKLTVDQMPIHNHRIPIVKWMHGRDGRRSDEASWSDGDVSDSRGRMPTNADTAIDPTGGDQPHENVQPSQTKYYWTRTA